jgi:TNF receptor-associated protein 1
MSREDLVLNLGTIARSGSKAFVDELTDNVEGGSSSTNIIGKFGVGFYSAFMVSDRVDVYSSVGDGTGWKWSSAGDGSYTMAPCKVVGEGEDAGEGKAPTRGTRIVLHVKEAEKTVAAAGWAVETTLKKYSAFVGYPVMLNGKRTNDIDALWTKRQNEVSDEDATAFYRFVGRVGTLHNVVLQSKHIQLMTAGAASM